MKSNKYGNNAFHCIKRKGRTVFHIGTSKRRCSESNKIQFSLAGELSFDGTNNYWMHFSADLLGKHSDKLAFRGNTTLFEVRCVVLNSSSLLINFG